jgi:hypothetical protein
MSRTIFSLFPITLGISVLHFCDREDATATGFRDRDQAVSDEGLDSGFDGAGATRRGKPIDHVLHEIGLRRKTKVVM